MSKQRTQKAPEPSASRSPAPIIAAAVVLGVLGLLIYTMLANSPGQQTAAQPVEAIPTIPVVPAVPTTPAEPAQPVAPAEPAAPAANSQTYSALPPMTIDPAKDYTATISMAKGGEIVIKLRPDLAPQTVNSFVFLAREGFYDGLTFHRVEPGFVIQGGDPDGTGTGGPGYNVPDEYTDQVLFDRPGLLAMASTGPGTNSGGSQFFITLGPADWLNNQYTIFGEVLAGQELVDAVQVGDVMQSVMISEG